MNIEKIAKARRSLLFVPGLRPDMFVKALSESTDIICIDLEDAVALHRKNESRALTMDLLSKKYETSSEIMVRINPITTRHGLSDLDSLFDLKFTPDALMLPKIKSASEIRILDELLSTENTRHLSFCVIIETNAALEHAIDIARSCSRITSLILGGVDMSADLRCKRDWQSLLYTRSRLVHAAASAGIDLLDVPYLDLMDSDGLVRETISSRDLGFTGRAAIHPKQLPVINQIFTPSQEDIDRARRVCAAFESSDTGLVVVDDELIELPVVRSMYRLLAIAQMIDES
ncbi:MAG: CoA ester lyase [Proteobacteria bacterium]|nr:CoA ester lyase [Pseudomonadota bacterium]MDA1330864.1 CoA ester lyase [Pseudomonadota bacterium]